MEEPNIPHTSNLKNPKLMVLAGSVAMLVAVLLLPLVNLKSYSWGLFELPHKIDRLVGSPTYQVIGYVLLAVLVIAPLALALIAWLKGRASKALAVLVVCCSLLMTVLLLKASRPNPGVGLWVYLVLAIATTLICFRNNDKSYH